MNFIIELYLSMYLKPLSLKVMNFFPEPSSISLMNSFPDSSDR